MATTGMTYVTATGVLLMMVAIYHILPSARIKARKAGVSEFWFILMGVSGFILFIVGTLLETR